MGNFRMLCACIYTYLYRWLLHDPKMELRTNYPPYTKAVEHYFKRLFDILVPLQSVHRGPIIGFQIENEYTYWLNDTIAGQSHLKFLYKVSDYYMYSYNTPLE